MVSAVLYNLQSVIIQSFSQFSGVWNRVAAGKSTRIEHQVHQTRARLSRYGG